MSPIAKAMLEIAASQVGVREVGGNNKGPEIVQYQKTTSLAPGAWPWCAAFVSYCLYKALQRNEVARYLLTVSKTIKSVEAWRCNSAGAFIWIDWATKRTGNGAQAGDIVVLDNKKESYMPLNLPNEKPRLTSDELQALIAPHAIDRQRYPVVVVGIRGYYKNTMGAPSVNDRGIYDDALFINTPQATVAFNGNTDPTGYRKGYGTAEDTKGMASLNTGAWFVHKFDKHNGKYLALCQRAGVVTVTRDGTPPYPDTGKFGINIHKGGYNGTSSEGCQTIHPDQWESFINLVKDQVKRYFGEQWQNQVVPYVLIAA